MSARRRTPTATRTPPRRPVRRQRPAAAGNPTPAAEADAASRPIAPRECGRLVQGLGRLRSELRKAHGRPPRPDDELFPELEGMGEEQIADAVAHAMEREGVDPALVYAFRKTGLLVTAETLPFLTTAGRSAWAAALREFRDRQD